MAETRSGSVLVRLERGRSGDGSIGVRLEDAEAVEFWWPHPEVTAAACFLDIATHGSRRRSESPPGFFIDAPSIPQHPRTLPIRAAAMLDPWNLVVIMGLIPSLLC